MRRAAVPVLAAVLVALAATLAGFGTLGLAEREQDPRSGPLELPPSVAAAPATPEVPDPAPPEPADDDSLGWLGDLLRGVAAAAVLVGLLLAVRVLRRALAHRAGGRTDPPRLRPLPAAGAGAEEPDQALLAALDAGLVALSDDDRDPRRAVIACWLRLQEVATAAGVSRHPADTAGDLVLRLLRTRQVSEPVLASLADTYRLARYGSRTVDEQMRTSARTALRRLREELRAPVPDGAR